MNKQEILTETQNYIKKTFLDEGTGHDYFHIERVVTNARKILKHEKADAFLVELAAWTHDIGDYKLHNGIDKSDELITTFLQSIQVDDEIIKKVVEIVSQVSFSKGNQPTSIEAKIVQDADRLDAIGAIGIARAFNYGGFKNRMLYDPNVQPNLNMSKEEYKKSETPTLNHFYEKLLLLKDKMNTETGKKVAKKRHDFMVSFLSQFYSEWEGNL